MTPGDVFIHHRQAGGLATRDSYPDSYEMGDECLFFYTMQGIQILGQYGYERVETGDEE